MRPRFKVWDKHLKEFVKFDIIHHPVFTDESYEFLLGTGQPDEDGNEIFEGDIVEIYLPTNLYVIRYGTVIRNVVAHEKTNSPGAVGRLYHFSHRVWTFEINGFYFEAIDNKKPYFTNKHDLFGAKIIGNIYDNPELLK